MTIDSGDKVTDIASKRKETTLCACTSCKLHWAAQASMHGTPPKCPTCGSKKTVFDQLWEIPATDTVFTCLCGNKYYKICRDKDAEVYFMCVACGQRTTNV